MIIKVSTEWDMGLGFEYCLEGSLKKAKKETKKMYNFIDLNKDLDMSFKKACKENLITFEEH